MILIARFARDLALLISAHFRFALTMTMRCFPFTPTLASVGICHTHRLADVDHETNSAMSLAIYGYN